MEDVGNFFLLVEIFLLYSTKVHGLKLSRNGPAVSWCHTASTKLIVKDGYGFMDYDVNEYNLTKRSLAHSSL